MTESAVETRDARWEQHDCDCRVCEEARGRIAYALRLLESAPTECAEDCEGMTERTCAACWANEMRRVLMPENR